MKKQDINLGSKHYTSNKVIYSDIFLCQYFTKFKREVFSNQTRKSNL